MAGCFCVYVLLAQNFRQNLLCGLITNPENVPDLTAIVPIGSYDDEVMMMRPWTHHRTDCLELEAAAGAAAAAGLAGVLCGAAAGMMLANAAGRARATRCADFEAQLRAECLVSAAMV